MINETHSDEKKIRLKNHPGYREVILGNRYACKSNGTSYYPRDDFGNEYRINGLNLIEKNGKYFYPRTLSGKPRYAVVNGCQIYDTVAGKPIIGTGLDGKQYYARDNNGNEYYPSDNTPALLADGTPYYASAMDGKHIFPIDKLGNEYYLTFVDLNNPETIPNRYAKSNTNDEIYPLRVTDDDDEEQYLIGNKYAVDRNKKPYYPTDGYKNEYYRIITSVDLIEYNSKGTLNEIVLERYALTNDGKIILPTVNNIYYIDPNIKPSIQGTDVIGRLIRENDQISDFLTSVTDPVYKSTNSTYVKPYKYRTLVSNELMFVIPKPPTSTFNIVGIINTVMPFYRRWCFWILIVVLLIVKSFLIWWFYFRDLPKSLIIT